MPGLTYRSPKTEVKASAIHGRGLFAKRAIAAREIVAVKGGHVLTAAEWRALEPELGAADIQIAEDLFVAPVTPEERDGHGQGLDEDGAAGEVPRLVLLVPAAQDRRAVVAPAIVVTRLTYVPRAPLSQLIELLWACDAYDTGHARARVLPAATCRAVRVRSCGRCPPPSSTACAYRWTRSGAPARSTRSDARSRGSSFMYPIPDIVRTAGMA